MLFADLKLHFFVDIESDLNLIQKDNRDHGCLRSFFFAKAITQTDNILVETYWSFCKRIKIINSLDAVLNTRIILTSTDIEVLLIWRLCYLQSHNLILKFDLMTI